MNAPSENREQRQGGPALLITSNVTDRGMKLDNPLRSHRKNRRGAAAVEFAVVAPVFFLFVFGMIEFGRMVMVQQILTNASREGARLAVLDGTQTADVVDTVTSYLSNSSIGSAAVDVTPDPPDSAAFGDPVTVTVSVGFDQVSWLPAPMFLSGQNLTAITVMRRESVQ